MFEFLNRNKNFELSLYNDLIKYEDKYLLFNQISGMLIMINEKNAQEYKRIEAGDFKKISKSLVKTLIKGGFLKKKGVEEREELRDIWEKNVNSTLHKSLTIVTTDRCNLGCTYCYEKKTEWRMLNEEVQEQLKKFTYEYLSSTKTKFFRVTWFGGEPTLNMQCIENLTQYFDKICKELNIPWVPHIITNGTTLNKNVVSRLKACKINALQITVDGIKEEHDAKRPYLSSMKIEDMNEYQIEQRKKIQPSLPLLNVIGQSPKPEKTRSSFDDIVNNIKNCYDEGIKVSLRINVDKSNKESAIKLYNLIKSKGWTIESENGGLVSIYTHPIFDGCGGSSADQMTRKEFSEYELEITSKMSENENSVRKSMTFTGDTCTANKNFQFVINPSGKIVKCWHHSTDDSYACGSIYDLELARKGASHIDKYKFNPFDDQECYNCHVLPLCMGGCKANNQFPEKGYSGTHDIGCVSLRWTLPEDIKNLYEVSKKERKENE